MSTQVAWLSNSPQSYHGRIFTVPWDAALSLRDLGAEFILLLAGNRQHVSQLTVSAENFMRFNATRMYAALVDINGNTKAAELLNVSMLPQVRLYRDGAEVRRLHGVASYEDMQKLLR